MLFHIDVEPHPDEPLLVTTEEIAAGLAWLHRWKAEGVIERMKARKRTGGYMDVRMPSADPVAARAQLDAWIADYPLLNTAAPITWVAEELFDDDVDDGFDVLSAAQAAGVRVADMVQA